MEAVLPVEYVSFDPSVEETGDVSQMSAEEYLSWVRHQASKLPLVFRAQVDSIPTRQTKYMPDVEQILKCKHEYLPTEDWEIETLHSFSELRVSLNRLAAIESTRERKEVVPQMKDKDAWLRFCFASDIDGVVTEEAESVRVKETENITNISAACAGAEASIIDTENEFLKRKRSLVDRLGLDVSRVAAVQLTSSECAVEDQAEDGEVEETDEICFPDDNKDLAYHPGSEMPRWTGSENVSPTLTLLLQFDQVLTQRVLTTLVDWLEERPALPTACGQWLYGLLARLEKPICQATSGTIRQLYRHCCALRYHLVVDSSSFERDLAALNVLISISGAYFGQGEEYVAFNHHHYDTLNAQDDADESDVFAEMEGDEEEEDELAETQSDKKQRVEDLSSQNDAAMDLAP